MQQTFKEEDLPFHDLTQVGLYLNSEILLQKADIRALLSSRRSRLITLYDLNDDGFHIPAIQTKLSLRPNFNNGTDLFFHPIYKNSLRHPLLSEQQQKDLEKGDIANILKIGVTAEGDQVSLLIEYDAETREFIESDTNQVSVPEKVNNFLLSEFDKLNFCQGKLVELDDGTIFIRRESNHNGVAANRKGLIFSYSSGINISYEHKTELKPLPGENSVQETYNNNNYINALKEMEDWEQQSIGQIPINNTDKVPNGISKNT